MRLFDTNGADAAYERWLTPKAEHEVDECEVCHEGGEHDQPLAWYQACDVCAKELKKRAGRAAFEFNFTLDDVEKAQLWARTKGYNYTDDVEHLLLDAFRSGAINTDKWTTL